MYGQCNNDSVGLASYRYSFILKLSLAVEESFGCTLGDNSSLKDLQSTWKLVRLVTIVEVSMMGRNFLIEIDEKLRTFRILFQGFKVSMIYTVSARAVSSIGAEVKVIYPFKAVATRAVEVK